MQARAPLTELMRVVWPFIVSAVLMCSLATACFHVMSAGRAYVDGESLWSKSQKDALLHLERYVDTCDVTYLQHYHRAMDVPFGDRVARLTLERTPEQTEAIRLGFEQGKLAPEDIDGMIFVFRWLGWVPALERAVDAWRQADEKLLEIHHTVERLQNELGPDCNSPRAHALLIARAHELNDQLTPLQMAFSRHLGEANRLLFKVAVAAMVLGSLVLALPGLWLAHRVIKSNNDALQRADEASRAKTEFLANMSHELRTPMNGVIGLIDTLHQSGLDESQRETAEMIRHSGTSLLALLDDVLDISCIEAGQLRLELVPVDSASVVDQVCGGFHAKAIANGVNLTWFTDPRLPAAVLNDPLRLRQIVTNLVCNAVKFSAGREQAGRVHVRWGMSDGADGAQGEPSLCLSVQDNGIGIAPHVRAVLFQAFMQADLSTTRRHGGTGLGLAITHHLVEAMGGRIEVDSTPGQGSTFTVTLPLHDATAEGSMPPQADERWQVFKGLPCVVLGPPEGAVADLAACLAHEGAWVRVASDEAQMLAAEEALIGQRQLWLVDATGPQVLQPAAALAADPQAQVLVLAWGDARRPLPDGPGRGRRLAINGLSRQAWLQAVHSVLQQPAPAQARAERQGPGPAALADRAERVLVAEDNPANQKVIAFQLRKLGFQPDLAVDGQQALKLALANRYDLVITDLHMPEMDGYQLASALRERGLRRQDDRHLPIIALTANSQSGEAQRCKAHGMDDFLTKPVTLPLLSATIDKWLQHAHDAAKASPCL